MTETVKCKHCQKELALNHMGPCPFCGKTGREINLVLEEKIIVRDSMSATHKPKWSGEALTIFFGLYALIFALFSSIILLMPWNIPTKIAIIVLFTLLSIIIFWWKRYDCLMLIRKLEEKLGGEKTTH